jgi:hypothetical protein
LTACSKGFTGNKIVLESNGVEIEDDDDLQASSQKNLMILDVDEEWSSSDVAVSSAKKSSAGAVLESDSNRAVVAVVAESNYLSKFSGYQFDVEKLPHVPLHRLKQGQKLHEAKPALIHSIIDDMRTISKQIPIQAIRDVVSKLSLNFPLSFFNIDEKGQPIITKNVVLVTGLMNHNFYLTRRENEKNEKSAQNVPMHISKRRKQNGLLQTSPNFNGDGAASTSLLTVEQRKEALRLNSKHELAAQFMMDSFNEIRVDISGPNFNIEFLLKEWPLLLQEPYVGEHFYKVIGEKAAAIESQKIPTDHKLNGIVAYGKNCNTKQMKIFFSKNKMLPDGLLAIKFLIHYFNENFNEFYQVHKKFTS